MNVLNNLKKNVTKWYEKFPPPANLDLIDKIKKCTYLDERGCCPELTSEIFLEDFDHVALTNPPITSKTKHSLPETPQKHVIEGEEIWTLPHLIPADEYLQMPTTPLARKAHAINPHLNPVQHLNAIAYLLKNKLIKLPLRKCCCMSDILIGLYTEKDKLEYIASILSDLEDADYIIYFRVLGQVSSKIAKQPTNHIYDLGTYAPIKDFEYQDRYFHYGDAVLNLGANGQLSDKVFIPAHKKTLPANTGDESCPVGEKWNPTMKMCRAVPKNLTGRTFFSPPEHRNPKLEEMHLAVCELDESHFDTKGVTGPEFDERIQMQTVRAHFCPTPFDRLHSILSRLAVETLAEEKQQKNKKRSDDI